ncbi:MAG: alpha/beta hydrolase [Arenicellales bacterium]
MCAKEKLPLHLSVSTVLLLLVSIFATGMARSQAEKNGEEDWFIEDPDAIYDAINEGELNFLEKPPDTPVHHHHNTFIVLKSSIDTGWINLLQCHENLDQIPRAQIVYNRDRIRHLRITEQKNIGEARVEGNTVQLTKVNSNARLCVEAESRALIAQKDGTFVMQNGPFMRKFLDGYFPMRVSIDINFPANLRFVDIEPVEQKGFKVIKGKQGLHLDAWFEGRLVTRIRFNLVPETKTQ